MWCLKVVGGLNVQIMMSSVCVSSGILIVVGGGRRRFDFGNFPLRITWPEVIGDQVDHRG